MCLEDLRMGRKKFTRVAQLTVVNTPSQQILPEARNRTHIRVGGDTTTFYIAPAQIGTTLATGFRVAPTKQDFEVDIETHGDVVTGPWVATSEGASCVLSIIETFYKDDGG